MYSIDNNRLANKKSILSNTNDGNYDEEFDQGKKPLSIRSLFQLIHRF